jgi:hypothetical protein
LLAQSIDFKVPAQRSIAAAARARARDYGWDELDRAEASRDSAREPAMREYRTRLQDGPIITLRQSSDSLSWSFDPTELVGFDLTSAVYPSGSFSAGWGKLTVERGGVLVANDFSRIRVAAPPEPIVAGVKTINGDGWRLALNPGWSIQPDPSRPRSFVVVKD